jgi:hypothetical protein
MTLNMNKYLNISKEDEVKDNFYELSGVLIHSGSLNSGHYYAYIKNEENEWFEFNDSTVTKIEYQDIEKAYGDENSHSNAYMLMYSREFPKSNEMKNLMKIQDESALLPKEILEEILKENEIYLKDYYKFEEERDYYKYTIIYNEKEHIMKFDHAFTILDSLKQISENISELKGVDLECLRLRKFNKELNIPQDIFENNETFKSLHLEYESSLYLEKKEKEFTKWNKNDITIQFYEVNEKKKDFKRIHFENFEKKDSMKSVSSFIESLKKEKLNFFRESKNEILKVDSTTSETLENLEFKNGEKLYIESKDDKFSTKELLEYLKNRITIHFNLPHSRYFNQSLVIDKRKRIKDLKSEISEVVKLEMSEFKIFNGKDENGYEFKNYDSQLNQLINGSSVFIQKGRVLKSDEFSITIFEYEKQDLPKPMPIDTNYQRNISRSNVIFNSIPQGDDDMSADVTIIEEDDDIIQDDDIIVDPKSIKKISQINPNKKIGITPTTVVVNIPTPMIPVGMPPGHLFPPTAGGVGMPPGAAAAAVGMPPGGAGFIPGGAGMIPIVANNGGRGMPAVQPQNVAPISAADGMNPNDSAIQYNNENFDENEIPLQLLGKRSHHYHHGAGAMNPKTNSFTTLLDLIINDKTTVKDLKKQICQQSSGFYPSLIRIREKLYKMDYPGRVLFDEEIINKSIDMTVKNKEIIVEKIEKIEILKKENFMLRIGRFYPSREAISFIEEILVDDKTTIGDLSKIVSKKFKISPKFIEFNKIPTILHSHLNDLSTYKKLKWIQIKSEDDLIVKSPYYLQNVDLLICQDSSEVGQNFYQSDDKNEQESNKKSQQLRFYDDDEKK